MADKQELEFVDIRERELYGAARLGEDAKEFLRNHPVGQLLHHRAKQAIVQAEVDALQVDMDAWPHFRGRNKLRAIKQRAAVAHAFIDWIAEAITDGNQAASELDEYRR